MTSEIQAFLNSMEKSIESRGKPETIRLYSGLHQIAIKIATEQPFQPLPFRKSDKNGVPNLIKGLYPFLSGSPEEKRLALTATLVYKTIFLEPNTSVETVVSPGADLDPLFIED